LKQTNEVRKEIEGEIAALLASLFSDTLKQAKWLPLSEVAPLVRREVLINPQMTYRELGVRSFYKGAFVRRTIPGSEFSWQKLYEIKKDDLIFSNIMAWEKAIALANEEHHLCVGNHRMLACEARQEISRSSYLHYYFSTDEGFAKVYAASSGTAARNRTLTADSLMKILVPVPPLDAQKQFVELKAALEDLTSISVASKEI